MVHWLLPVQMGGGRFPATLWGLTAEEAWADASLRKHCLGDTLWNRKWTHPLCYTRCTHLLPPGKRVTGSQLHA